MGWHTLAPPWQLRTSASPRTAASGTAAPQTARVRAGSGAGRRPRRRRGKLVATGFLAPQEERRGTRGAREVPYLATGKSWTLDVHGSGVSGGGTAMMEAFLDEARLIDMDNVPYARLGLRLSEPDLRELKDRLDELLNDFRYRAADPGGSPYSIVVALYPDVSRD
jgi:hypothetical protein